MKHIQKPKLITPEKVDNGYFTEIVIFLVLMIIAIAVIVYLGMIYYQSKIEGIPVPS